VITAVDTSVLLDILTGDEPYAGASAQALVASRRDGAMVASDIVWAETAAWFEDSDAFASAMADLGVDYDPLGMAAAALGGELWRTYRADGGSRVRLVPDFLIGAHALMQADRLLTRDRGFFRRYFAPLVLLEPSVGHP
jgi:hypothetical protein